MILKNIKLENIRSYTSQEINFNEGSVLLSGNIGSGKSTILLAIDFALFGLRKDIGGGALLRNGKNSGSVQLNFDLDGKDIIIKRLLKRANKGVVQETGEFIVNGHKEEVSPIELKQRVLELLNYPQDLLNKTKALVYRYTVYTPQEEMKQILLVDRESRIDILRKVFGVDKYKKIKENVKIINSFIRNKITENKNSVADLDIKNKEKDEKKKVIEEINKKLTKSLEELKRKDKIIEEEKIKLKDIEKKAEELSKSRKEFEINSINLENRKRKLDEIKEELLILLKDVKELNKEIKPVEFDIGTIKAKEEGIRSIELSLKEINKKLSEFNLKNKESNSLIEEINHLKLCPTCKQNVSEDHKKEISLREKNKINEIRENIEKYNLEERNLEEKLSILKKELDILRKIGYEAEIIKLKIKNLNEKKSKIENITKISSTLDKEIKELEDKRKIIEKEIKGSENIEESKEKLKDKIELLRSDFRKVELEKVGLEKDFERDQEICSKLEKEIEEKLKIKERLEYLISLSEWLSLSFINLISSIEKRIMIKLHYDFDKLFQKWFNMLVNDDLISIKLDDEFTPLIEQNGYDIEYENLSGGEKTAAALSYRLALNQVINDLTTNLRTRDLIILDEPTDGFSNEQLERMRSVLEELSVKQIVIVSHDPKIESFVDSVIKLEKKGHISEIV